ncbi:MAG: hypothetical protein ACLUG4_01310 [Bacilli bacterium]
MNSILQLKGTFESKKNNNIPRFPNLPTKCGVSSVHIKKLINELSLVLKKWEKDTLIDGALVSVHYIQVVAKSNRIKSIFEVNSQIDSNASIRGSKFEQIGDKINHVFTHYVDLQIIKMLLKS